MQNAKAEKEEKRTGCYRHTQMQKDLIIEKLKERGLRITRQRRILLDIILEGECSCCKEIYTGLPHWTRRSVWQRYTV